MTTNTCKICGNDNLVKVIDLGKMPNANTLVAKGEKAKSYSLAFYWCDNCTFLQQISIAPREDLFNNKYPYITGVNAPSVENYKEFAISMKKRLRNRNFAVVIASNDGTEIKLLKEFGGFKKVIGVDPSSNLVKIANDNGQFTIDDFFSYDLSKKIVEEYGHADLVAAKGVFAHIPDPKDMLLGMKNLIKQNGTIAIEVHYLKSLIEQLEIECLYEEHHYVYDTKAMKYFANSVGLKLVGVEYLPDRQGGSIRFIIKNEGSEAIANKYIAMEKKSGLYSIEKMRSLQKRAVERKIKLRHLVQKLKRQNKKIAVWSASAKVPTLLNFCRLSNKEIDCVYEIAESKIGKFIPMMNVEIRNERFINRDKPDYMIIGSWEYVNVARRKLKDYLENGGKFINPLSCQIVES